jgi:hypothetical protein
MTGKLAKAKEVLTLPVLTRNFSLTLEENFLAETGAGLEFLSVSADMVTCTKSCESIVHTQHFTTQ